jgi:hypothetical protein
MAQTNLMVSDLNDRNQAAQRNYGAAATGQISQWSQVQEQMRNQKERDAQMLESIKGYLGLFNPGAQKPTSTGWYPSSYLNKAPIDNITPRFKLQ